MHCSKCGRFAWSTRTQYAMRSTSGRANAVAATYSSTVLCIPPNRPICPLHPSHTYCQELSIDRTRSHLHAHVTHVAENCSKSHQITTSLAPTSSTIGTTEKSHTGAWSLKEGRTLGGLAVFVTFNVSMKTCCQYFTNQIQLQSFSALTLTHSCHTLTTSTLTYASRARFRTRCLFNDG